MIIFCQNSKLIITTVAVKQTYTAKLTERFFKNFENLLKYKRFGATLA